MSVAQLLDHGPLVGVHAIHFQQMRLASNGGVGGDGAPRLHGGLPVELFAHGGAHWRQHIAALHRAHAQHMIKS